MEYAKMDPEWKEKWIAALESGDYKQGRNGLRSGDNYCCLGVLCDIYDNTQWSKRNTKRTDTLIGYFDGRSGTPTEEQVSQTKLTTAAIGSLWRLNDLELKTFPEIAAWIRENL